MATGTDLIRAALLELLVINPTQDVSSEDAEFGLAKLNRLFDRWNARSVVSFARPFTAFTLTPSLNPHTIGPSGATWTATVRPVRIHAANLVVSDTRYRIEIRNSDWYASQSSPELTSTIPTDLYYEAAVPNGKVWLYPVPSAAYQVELWTLSTFGTMALADTLVAPPGYEDAIVKTLAEDLAGPFRVPMPPDLPRLARDARAGAFANNMVIPSLCTADYGLGGDGGTYNYETGLNE